MEWNSEAGRVRGIITKKLVSDVRFKKYIHHASKDEPEYLIKSDKTDHIAVHKGRALKFVKAQTSRCAPGGARLRRVRVVRDYGMLDRREAPQCYPDVGSLHKDFLSIWHFQVAVEPPELRRHNGR
jgi:Hypervirulence associated proteins TUDOR domain